MTTTGETERLGVDLLDPGLYAENPHATWAWMRAHEPVYRDERNALWGVSRHRDVMDVERRSSVFVSGLGYRALPAPGESNMIAQDDPRHRQQRMLVQPRLTRAAVETRRDEVAGLVRTLVDGLVERGTADVVEHLAAQVAARLTTRLIGFPEEWWPRLRSWSERLMRTDMRDRDPAVMAEFIAANTEFVEAMQPVLAEVTACPAHDLMSIWAHARIDGEPLPLASIVHEVGLFIAGGAETTRTAISHGLRVFADHPGQWDAMGADPALVEGAVEEVLRWVTPLNNFFRTAIADDRIGDTDVSAGDRIVLLYPSANRDEDVFADPFTFDIRRSPNPHLAFGFGTHLCVGANLARLVLGEVFGQLSSRCAAPVPSGEPDVEANIFARAVRRFEVTFTAR